MFFHCTLECLRPYVPTTSFTEQGSVSVTMKKASQTANSKTQQKIA